MKPKFIRLKMDPLSSTHHQGQHQYYEPSVYLKKKKGQFNPMEAWATRYF